MLYFFSSTKENESNNQKAEGTGTGFHVSWWRCSKRGKHLQSAKVNTNQMLGGTSFQAITIALLSAWAMSEKWSPRGEAGVAGNKVLQGSVLCRAFMAFLGCMLFQQDRMVGSVS